MDDTITLKALDPELSFGAESIGRKKKFLVGQDKNIIVFSEDMWGLGATAYDMCAGKYSTMSIPCSLEHHIKNLQECKRIADSLVEFMQESASKGFIRDDEGALYSDEDSSKWLKLRYHHKIQMIQSFIDAVKDLDDSEPPWDLANNLYFYGVMHLLDEYIILDRPWSSEGLFNSIKELIHYLEKRTAIEKAVSRRAKSAVKVRHGKTYEAKEQLRQWHKNNRHEFLKPDGSLHQADAAEHVCYVLKITTLKAKKVAEYMGEFEKDLKK